MITAFQTLLGLIFVFDALLRLRVLVRKLPLPVMNLTLYRQSMHINMVLGVCQLACVLLS